MRGVVLARGVQTPVRGGNLAGFLQLAGQDEGEHQIVAARMVVGWMSPSSLAVVAATLRSIHSAGQPQLSSLSSA